MKTSSRMVLRLLVGFGGTKLVIGRQPNECRRFDDRKLNVGRRKGDVREARGQSV